MKKKLLLIGPFPEPITGNSLSNKIIFDEFTKKKLYSVKKINTSLTFFDENVGLFSFKKLFQALKFNLEFYKVIFSDVIYITPGQTFLGVLKYSLFIFLAKFSLKKIVIHIHGNHLQKSYLNASNFKKVIIKLVLRQSSKGIVLSESLTPNLTSFLDKSDINVVYNFVENYLVNKTASLIKEKKLDTLRIIYLSNLMEEKGILDLLEALKLMEDNNMPFEAKVAGNIDIKSKEKIEAYFKTLKNAEYLGIVRGEEKKKLLLWGNVFVFPSYYQMEGQPISLLEAMSTGNIVLTTNHAGISDVFENTKNGLYINKKSPDDIVLKLEKLQNNRNIFEALLYNNYCYGKENFSIETFLNNLETIFN